MLPRSAFGEFEVRLDPWQVEYGAEVTGLAGIKPEEGSAQVDLTVEAGAGDWRPIFAGAAASEHQPAQVFFVDGVRRLEARIVVRHAGGYAFGGFGSYAVGAVRSAAGRARFDRFISDRVVVVGSGVSLPGAVEVRPGISYRPVSAMEGDEDAPGLAVHDEMRRAEERLARELADAPDTLVIADGPLTFEDPVRGAAVGYVKQLMKLYIEGAALEVLRKLPERARTPVFALSAGRFSRYSWFMRLEQPRLGDADFSGIVRLEVAETIGSERARALADACLAMVPRFRSVRGLHSRAPQNLLPIGALEQRLRHELGDALLLRRFIEDLLAREAS